MREGDTLRVLNRGSAYLGYREWARKHGATRWKENAAIPLTDFRIVKIAPHSDFEDVQIALLEGADGQQYMFGLDNPENYGIIKTSVEGLGRWAV